MSKTESRPDTYVAKRRLDQSWREAVEERGGELGVAEAVLSEFYGHVSSGKAEHEAAFLALEAVHGLWPIKAPEPEAEVEPQTGF